MYKKSIDIYKTQSINNQLSNQENVIIKKAKKYGISVFENEQIAKKLLSKNIPDEPLNKEALELFAWCLESEKTTQMSS